MNCLPESLFRFFAAVLVLCGMCGDADSQVLDEPSRLILEARGLARQEKYQEAIAVLERSLELAEQSGQTLLAAVALKNMAEIHRLRGDAARADQAARRALDLYGEAGAASGRRAPEAIAPHDAKAADAAAEPTREAQIERALERVRQRLRERNQGEESAKSAPGDPEYQAYLATVKKTIVASWKDPQLAASDREEGKVGVRFTILRDGAIDALRLFEPSDYLPLNIEALRAVTAAAPFPPIPEGLGFARIEVEFTFNYLFPETGGRPPTAP